MKANTLSAVLAVAAVEVAHMCKVKCHTVAQNIGPDGKVTSETWSFGPVFASTYLGDGYDENNTFARFSPSVNFTMTCTNPALFGKLRSGQEFYVPFVPVVQPQADLPDEATATDDTLPPVV